MARYEHLPIYKQAMDVAVHFEKVAAGIVDPVEAGLKGTIKITGDMRILIKHADLVNVVQEVYQREVETTWPKAQPPMRRRPSPRSWPKNPRTQPRLRV